MFIHSVSLSFTEKNGNSFSARDDEGLYEDIGLIWYQSSILAALMLYGLAVFFFLFGVLPYWFKVHKHLNEILGCKLHIRTPYHRSFH